MEYRNLGRAGLKISAFSFGSWVTFGKQLDISAAKECMTLAYDEGVNFFDNAEVYAGGESERIMGKILKELGWGRDTYCVSSKVFWGGDLPTQRGLCRKHIFEACHAAMKRLQVDYLDLYFCHRPDPETPIEETARAMHDLITQGKVMYWGTSEWSAEQLDAAYSIAFHQKLIPPTMEQPQYNLFHRERMEKEYRPLFEKYGMGTTIWSPLASGVLTGKYNEGIPSGSRMALPGNESSRAKLESPEGQKRIEKARKLTTFADELGIPLSHLALAWCLKNPHVSSVILGASNRSQLEDNLEAMKALPALTADVMSHIDKMLR